VVKYVYWQHIDKIPRTHTKGEATGLGAHVRQWEVPHTNVNFIQKEMGFAVARRHAKKLRTAVVTLFAAAIAVAVLAWLIDPWVAILMAPLTISAAFVERWLFFAEAEHVVNLFYEKDAA
jgi:sulfite dehydrogenase (quinone) subunit SoeC